MSEKLNETEARVVGALVEKQLTTPEYYPLTLNALVAACNQKTNREPVVNYDEQAVQQALDNLRERNLVYVFYGSTSRVPKYKHMVPEVFHLDQKQTALLCVLMLRGPQTAGELRERAGRLAEIATAGEVEEALTALRRMSRSLWSQGWRAGTVKRKHATCTRSPETLSPSIKLVKSQLAMRRRRTRVARKDCRGWKARWSRFVRK